MNYGLHVIGTPTGKFYFVGNVPHELGFTDKAGKPVSGEYVTEQLMLPSAYRSIKTRVFDTYEAAQEAAKAIGARVSN